MIKISISKLPQIDKLIGSELFLVTDKHGPDADSKAASAETIATFAIQQLQGIKGQPNGLAPLDANALVPEKHLPSTAFGVIQFGGMVSGVTVQESTSDKGYKIGGAVVVYNSDTNRFILKVPDGGTDTFYRDWSNSELHGRPDSDGSVIPRTDKIFIHPQGGGLAYIMTAEKLERFALQSAITSLQTLIAQLQNTKADLDGSCHVKLAQIPDDALDVVEFRGFADVDADSIEVSPAWNADLTNAYVVYNRTNNRFLLSFGSHYYSRWPDSDRFGISHWKFGATPYPHKTYFRMVEVIDDEDNSHFEREYYRWNGYQLTINFPDNPAIILYSYGVISTESKYHVVKGSYAPPSATSSDSDVVYAADLKRFMLRTPGATADVTNLYPTFIEQAEYGTPDNKGIIPHSFKLYRNSASGEFQQWDGEKLTTPLSTYELSKQKADIDDSGHVPIAQIPDNALDVIKFGWLVNNVLVSTGGIGVSKYSDEGYVVYDLTLHRFLLKYGEDYYANWADSERFGNPRADGVEPYANKTYIIESHPENAPVIRRFYHWNGVDLDGVTPYVPSIVTYDWDVDSSETLDENTPKYTVIGGTLNQSITDSDARVVYDTKYKRFMRLRPIGNGQFELYTKWREHETFGADADTHGVIPHNFKVYRNAAAVRNNIADLKYRMWDGTELTTPLSPFGVKTLVNALETQIATLNQTVSSQASLIETLDGVITEMETANEVLSARLNGVEFAVNDPNTGLAKTIERVQALETRFAGGVLLL